MSECTESTKFESTADILKCLQENKVREEHYETDQIGKVYWVR